MEGNSIHSRISYKFIFIWFITLFHFLKQWVEVFLCSPCYSDIMPWILFLWSNGKYILVNFFLTCVKCNKKKTL